MLERVQRKGNPIPLLVGMQTSTAAMENSVEIPQKLQIELSYDPAIPLLDIHTEETRIERDTGTPMFIAALFIILCFGIHFIFLLRFKHIYYNMRH